MNDVYQKMWEEMKKDLENEIHRLSLKNNGNIIQNDHVVLNKLREKLKRMKNLERKMLNK